MAPTRTSQTKDFIGALRTLSSLPAGCRSLPGSGLGGLNNRSLTLPGVTSSLSHRMPHPPTAVVPVVADRKKTTPGCKDLGFLATAFCAPAPWSTPIVRLGLADYGHFTRERDLSIEPKICRAASKCGQGEAPLSAGMPAVGTAGLKPADQLLAAQPNAPAISLPGMPSAPTAGACRGLADKIGECSLAGVMIAARRQIQGLFQTTSITDSCCDIFNDALTSVGSLLHCFRFAAISAHDRNGPAVFPARLQ